MTARIFVKLILAVLLVLIVALITVDWLASRVAESAYVDTLRRELVDRARILTKVIAGQPDFSLVTLARTGQSRLTLVASDGTVLFDSEAIPAHMENHRSRPEIADALAGRTGSSTRQSPTMGTRFLYVAVPYQSGALRLAVPLTAISAQVNLVRRRILVSTALAFLPAILLAAIFARYVSSKLAGIIYYASELAKGNFELRLPASGRDELSLLSSQLNEMGRKLQQTIEELAHERAELEKVERIRKDFVINVSHELRTPLASIQGYTETLLDGALHDADHNVRFLSIIRQNAERLGRLVSDLLTLSGLELKSRRLQIGPQEINSLVAEDLDSVRPMAIKKNIVLSLEPAPEPATALCDSEAVHQILGNLLDNALKYTPVGGSITVGIKPSGEAAVEVYVRDSGIGIPAPELPRLFERFYRVDKARSRELGGTGLGLSIVKHLVRAQGGEVGVLSEPGRGSVFSFTLPLQGAVQPALTKL